MANRRLNVDDVLNQLFTDSESDDELSLQNVDEEMVLEDVLMNAAIVRQVDMMQSPTDRELPTDIEGGWGSVDSPPLVIGLDYMYCTQSLYIIQNSDSSVLTG